ncbi:N-acetyltransferase family protein [Arachidicoccus sp.]|uniref:GNAT family N-acetyltransferase n=1 Tax=Arachidicoccus sp. TaxID=1872624 RepID=UPI003D196673
MFTIRNAKECDLPYIQEIMNDAVLNTTAIYDYHERDGQYVKNWFDNMQKQSMPILVCAYEGRCAGYGCYTIFRPKDGYRFCVEHSVYVHKDFRGKGIGAELLNALIERARSENYHTMIAGIDAENTFSIEFHKKYGFTEVGYLKEVGFKFDRWLDLVFMEKIL